MAGLAPTDRPQALRRLVHWYTTAEEANIELFAFAELDDLIGEVEDSGLSLPEMIAVVRDKLAAMRGTYEE